MWILLSKMTNKLFLCFGSATSSGGVGGARTAEVQGQLLDSQQSLFSHTKLYRQSTILLGGGGWPETLRGGESEISCLSSITGCIGYTFI